MAEKQTEHVQHENELTYADKVLAKIAYYAVSNIDGILDLKGGVTSGLKGFFSNSGEDETKGVNAEVGKKEVALDLEVIGEFGKDLVKAFDETVKHVKADVEEMTGLKVVEVNMNVVEVYTRSEYQQKQSDDDRQAKAREREYTDNRGGARVQ